MAKEVLVPLLESDQHAEAIIEARGLKQISDSSALEGMVQAVLDANPTQVEQFKAGKDKVIGFLMGQVMKQSKGQADPALTQELLRIALIQRRDA